MSPLSRRQFLALSAVSFLARPTLAADSTAAAERAHSEIWRRFIDRRFDVLLHYAGLKGEVILPVAADCREARPNGMSWSSPIEDGPFFGGLYLDGLCNRWRARRDVESAEKARRILATALHPYLQAFYRDWPMPAPEAGFRSFNARY